MYGVPQRQPSFINAWLVVLLFTSPVLLWLRLLHPAWLYVGVWLIATAIIAQRVMQRTEDDYGAKYTMFEYKQRHIDASKKDE